MHLEQVITDETIEAMIREGGSFVHRLARLYIVADTDNRRRIRDTWPEIFRRYERK